MVIYQFTDEEKEQVRAEARRRQECNQERGIKGRNNARSWGRKALAMHKWGAAGEMAVAGFLNLKDHLYTDIRPIKGSYDLPFKIDVKTSMRHRASMPVQKRDALDKIYWHVTIEDQECRIHGWLERKYCTHPMYWKDPVGGRPAFFVPKEALNRPQSFYECFPSLTPR